MINNVERIKKLKEENYQKIFGIKKKYLWQNAETFE